MNSYQLEESLKKSQSEAEYWKAQYEELLGRQSSVEVSLNTTCDNVEEVLEAAKGARVAFWGECKGWEYCCEKEKWMNVGKWIIGEYTNE